MTRHLHVGILLASLSAVAFPVGGQAADAPVEIPVITPLTGLGAFLGKQDQAALQIGEKVINQEGGIRGRPVKFVMHDDQSNPQVAVQLLTDVLGAKPSVVLGSHLTATCLAMSPLMKNGPVHYCFSPALYPAAGSYTYSSTVATRDVESAQLRFFRMKGITRIALLASTDASGRDGERNLDELLKLPENKDLTLVERANFNTTDVSVAAQMERIKSAKPQALIAWTTGTPLATVFKALVQSGIDMPVAITYSNMTYAQMDQYAGFVPKILYVPSSSWPPHPASLDLGPGVEAAQRRFYDAFKAAGITVDVGATASWDPMMLVVDALRKLGPDATAAQLQDYLQHLKGYTGLNGVYDFEKVPQRGLDESNAVVTRWSPEHNGWDVVSKPAGIPLQ